MKKNIKLFFSVALTLAVISSTLFSHNLFAATSTEESTATIGFTPNTDPTPPVDPEDPTQPGGEPGTGAPGPLSIDFISSLAFGTHTVSRTQETYNTTVQKPYIQVTDLRGTGAGWKVTASVSAFNNGTGNTLNGAYLQFNNGSAVSPTEFSLAPNVNQGVKLTTDNTPASIVQAPDSTGMGTWVTRWFTPGNAAPENDSVQLVVPAGASSAGTHTATITWSLVDAP